MSHLLVLLHGYPPSHRAGAEWAMHELVQRLRAHGHTAEVLQTRRHPGEFEGVPVATIPGEGMRHRELLGYARRADAILTHLDHGLMAAVVARDVGIPVVHYVHNDGQFDRAGIGPDLCDLALMNSEWLAKAMDWPGEWMIQHPIVPCARYSVGPGAIDGNEDQYWTWPDAYDRGYVTQVYLTRTKGSGTFFRLADTEQSRLFLGVVGSYGDQADRPSLPNVVYQETTTDMRDYVYARTRVLLVPSDYESWGRVAVEAMAAGIPVIAHPTDGLRESLAGAGLFADRADLEAWQACLASLDDREHHAQVATAGVCRALALEARSYEQAADVSSWLWHNT